jgi:lipopolysaccharide/colanic/teichoic acid biosynthesis glycosyltransferase
MNKFPDLKRCVDMAFASVALAASLPLMLATAGAMGVATRSFPVFRQQRVGLGGKLFSIFKIKTMKDADGLAPNDASAAAGRLAVFVRKARLDELPQFINVLRGEMSVVGPRPKQPHEPEAQDPLRCSVLPGITGLAQIFGLNALPPAEILALDRAYIDRANMQGQVANLIEDVRIMAITPGAMLAHWAAPHHRRAFSS